MMDDLISRLSEIRSQYNLFNESEEPYYRALSEVIKMLSGQADGDTISRQAAISELMEWVEKEKNKSWSPFKGLFHWTAIKAMLECLPSAQPERKWIPVTKKAHPDLPIRVQVQMDNGWIITAYYQDGEWLSVPDCGEPLKDKWIEAWRELPELYEERREE